MIATACDVGGSFGPLGCSRHVVSAATRPTATTGENRVMREPMAHLWPGAYLPRRSRALEVGAGSGTNGTIGLVGAEPHPPYNRPPLSKALWKGDPEESIWRKTAATGAQLTLGRRVTAIDPRGHTATDDRGTVYRFEKLLLATGGLPRRLPAQSDAVIYFRTLEDYRRLRGLALRGDRRRFYRERDCRGAADARGGPRRHHARPRSRGRSAGVSRGSVDVPRGLLPAKGRGDADGRGGGRDRPARRQVCPAHDHRWRVDGRRRRRGPRHRAGRRARPAGRATRGERDRGRRVLPHQPAGCVRRGRRRQLREPGAG